MSQQVVEPNAVAAVVGPRAASTRRPLGPAARRRRVLLVLGVTGVVLGLSARLARPLIWVSVADGVVILGYLALVTRIRHLAVQREMAVAFAAPDGGFDWGAFERFGAAAVTDDERVVIAAGAGGAGRLTWCRFAAAYLLGWALTPVAIVIRLLGGDRRDLEGGGILARLVALQRHGRAHSLRALAMSVATTAGVSAVGVAGMAASAPSASAAPAPGTYTVRSGDTLAGIAAAHGTTVAALVAANHLVDPNVIYAGQQLVPGGTSAPPDATSGVAGGGTYTVEAGDTLGSIAARYATSVIAMAAANGIADPNVIEVGQTLRVSGSAGSTPQAAPAGAAGAAGAPAPAGGSYTVRAGDTLGSIAARYATTTSALAAANHLRDPNMILVGQVLTLGGSGAATATPPAAPGGAAAPAPAAPTPGPAPAVALVAAPSKASAGATAVAVALAQVGKPYEWAGAGPSSFDCSGLVMYAYEAVGVALPHYTVTQYQDTARIAEADLQPGDLVFYGGSAPSHVAMYVGSGQVVTADTTGTPVRVEPITWDGTPSGFGRVG